MDDAFLSRNIQMFDRPVFRLGLATNYGISGEDLEWAIDNGMNYVFWPPSAGKVVGSLKDLLRRDRESIILATGPTLGYFGGSIKRGCERLLKKFSIDYIDVLQLFWLGRTSAWTPSTIEALASLKEEGKVRAIGISIHDRIRAGKLAEESPIDLFMIRYNAAHTGAEQEIFPFLSKRKPAVVTYTATRWRGLLKGAKGWDGQPMTAADCYRFCLSNSHVDITLTGPKTRQQLEENLKAVREGGPLSDEEMGWMRDFGQVVHRNSSRFTFGF